MVRAIDASGLKSVIDRNYGLGELAAAFRYPANGGHFAKICLDF